MSKTKMLFLAALALAEGITEADVTVQTAQQRVALVYQIEIIEDGKTVLNGEAVVNSAKEGAEFSNLRPVEGKVECQPGSRVTGDPKQAGQTLGVYGNVTSNNAAFVGVQFAHMSVPRPGKFETAGGCTVELLTLYRTSASLSTLAKMGERTLMFQQASPERTLDVWVTYKRRIDNAPESIRVGFTPA